MLTLLIQRLLEQQSYGIL